MAKIGVVIGSDSDWPVFEPGWQILTDFGVETEVLVASAHRTPDVVREFAVSAGERGIQVFIAVAGAAAHLPGVMASFTTLPVIGVPVSGSALKGVDALLSIAQMPAGVPVGTMAIDGGKNAALYAISILALSNESLARRLLDYRNAQAEGVRKRNDALREKIRQKQTPAR
ncbi:MAG: 5-(carboxyamino)imidazole ribonucleotide mutase [Synergistaceae bacterium]|jgi:5-(carboxyamino)imidazole ribonucleotide mutase|nr:5-(carboxyamino)imidazole ribonucleotide mutase [Synergistaceae bacterium]